MTFVSEVGATALVTLKDAMQMGRLRRPRFGEFIKNRAVDEPQYRSQFLCHQPPLQRSRPDRYLLRTFMWTAGERASFKRILRKQLGNHG
jgi:hypothetical protein